MRIVSALIAVLGLTAVVRPSAASEYFNETFADPPSHLGRHTRKHKKAERNRVEDYCCPTVQEMVEPVGGKNQEGLFVELYRDNNYRQRFYEMSCTKEALNRPCKYVNRTMHKSRCVQKISYTYALVKNTEDHRNKNLPMLTHTGELKYTLDYIQVRSGCSCVVMRNAKSKRNRKKNATAAREP